MCKRRFDIYKSRKIKKIISIIKKVNKNAITYIRGKSPIRLRINDLYNIYYNFKEKVCTTSDLKNTELPSFNEHGCNCIFLFMLLKQMNLVDEIKGEGKKGSPFYVYIK
ncbi:hypothetical protein [Clostridium pasteurianum]|uniref:Uncharacterized protein n=1 Tax=Clostridium pasteurianum BC1 TaxID=86416 RepID=R4KAL2_CLOPA|nr:hypothetical protein [Clostridium pasteurianum]AGK96680.1 hypothetical protein Clopa_1766 [Clostridium pasteurianum BC1]